MDKYKYFKSKPHWCPVCENSDIIHTVDEVDWEDTNVVIGCECSECKFYWVEEYKFIRTLMNMGELKKGRKEELLSTLDT